MKKLLWIGLALLIILVGCDLTSRDFYRAEDDFPENGKGMLVLILDGNELATKTTIDPNTGDVALPADVSIYKLTGDHSNGSDTITSTDLDPAKSVHLIEDLTPGDWDILITAWNSGGLQIGSSATEAINIVMNITNLWSVQVLPLTTPGSLNLEIRWLPTSVPEPQVNATLTQLTGTGWTTPDIGDGATGGFDFDTTDEANYNNGSMPAGYYNLSLTLLNDGTEIMGQTLVVRIVSNLSTDGLWDLTGDVGDLGLTIIDRSNPIGISMPLPAINVDGITYDVIATLQSPPAVDYVYEWYIDGNTAAVGRYPASGTTTLTSATYVLDPSPSGLDLSSGSHNLCVVVTASTGGVIDSVSSEFVSFPVP